MFAKNGTGAAHFRSLEGSHDIDACDCNLVDTEDLLEFDDDCTCRIFEDPKRWKEEIADPERDIERRINK